MNARADDLVNPEQAFVVLADGLDWDGADSGVWLARLDDWLARLSAEFVRPRLRWSGMRPEHTLAVQAADLDTQLASDLRAWLGQRDRLGDTQALARALDDKAVFLLFGKFDAGKSSLCNFVAERFAMQGRSVAYFRIDSGRIVMSAERFAEGATETTTALQGVCLGERLVLLDTPGLHSVTPENAALTQRFTDIADGVLWLTGSSSPGQVQELEELGRELHRAKPLLPLVTRSDCLEEDEVDGEIVKRLRNKTPANRAIQEADVLTRGREKLLRMGADPALLMPPVSLSVHAARKQGQTPDAMARAGFDTFWTAFAELVGPACAYQCRKSAEIALHHREEQVLHRLRTRHLPALDTLRAALDAEQESLQDRRAALVRSVWRAVAPELPELLESRAGPRGLVAVYRTVSGLLRDAFGHASETVFAGYQRSFAPGALEIASPDGDTSAGMNHERLHAALEDSARTTLLRAAEEAVRQCLACIEALRSDVESLRLTLNGYDDELMDLKRSLRSAGSARSPLARPSPGAG